MKMFYVEQDRFRTYDPMEDIKKSYNYLKNASFV